MRGPSFLTRGSQIALIALLTVSLAGCTGLLGMAGPSISEPRADVVDGQPVLMFEYEVDDYTSVLLEDPSGDVVARSTVEPDDTEDAFEMEDPTRGTYKLIAQVDGETQAEQEVSFSGSDPAITSVETNWSANTLQRLTITVENNGDLPARVSDPTVEIYNSSIESVSTTWIAPNESEMITVSPSYGELQVKRPGDARGTVSAETRTTSISDTFQETFRPANLSIVNTEVDWQGNSLESVKITVRNTGDLPTEGNAVVLHKNSELATTSTGTIPAGDTAEFVLDYGTVFQQISGGTVELTAVVNSSDGFAEQRITHTAEPANLSIQSVDPQWEDANLQAVEFTIRNTGDVGAEFSSSLVVGGSQIQEYPFSIDGGTTATYAFEPEGYSPNGIYTVDSGGEVPVTVSIDSQAGSGSVTETAEFEGVETEISSVDPTFYSQYGSDNVELGSISFSVRNTGDTPVVYDAIRLRIDGVSQTVSFYGETTIDLGSSESEYQTLSEPISVSPGTQDLTIELVNDGETVASGSTTVSADSG